MTEAVTGYLVDMTEAGVEISSTTETQPPDTHDQPIETVTAYLPLGPDAPDSEAAAEKTAAVQQFLQKAGRFFPECPAPVFHTEIITEEDWGEKWKRFFTSFQVTPTLTIKPSWEGAAPLKNRENADGAVIEMDPGLAFGTGHHASTQLALLLLDELFQTKGEPVAKVLDVGTGSGILALACGLFGAREVLALDNDPDAVTTARQNVSRNHLVDLITVSECELSGLKPVFNLIVANITHDILAGLAPALAGLVKPRGFLVLSGILKGEQENSLKEIYAGQGLVLRKTLEKDEWAAMQFQKK